MRKILKSLVLIGILVVMASHATLSAFTTEGKVMGNYFSTGHTDLSLFKDMTLPPTAENLARSVPGFNFNDITPFWQKQVGLKVINTGSLPLQTVFAAFSELQTMTPDLKDIVNVKVIRWLDNGDGVIQSQELASETESKTLSSWQATPFTLGVLPPQYVAAYVLEFEVGDLDNSYQGSTAALDFIFDAVAAN